MGASETLSPVEALELRARRAYELGRVRLAVLAAAPVAVACGVLFLTYARRGSWILGVGGLVVALVLVASWWGRELGRSVVPGVVSGAIPLALACAAQGVGHVCTDDGCVSLCVPACLVGGLVAGALVGRFAGRAPATSGMGAVVLAGLTGSLGCSCVGLGGVAGLLLGLFVAGVPAFALARSV